MGLLGVRTGSTTSTGPVSHLDFMVSCCRMRRQCVARAIRPWEGEYREQDR